MKDILKDIEEQIAALTKQRDQALCTLDLKWARRMIAPFDPHVTDFVLLTAMHKVRYDTPRLPEALRHESGEWLRANGMKCLFGLPLLPPGELPR